MLLLQQLRITAHYPADQHDAGELGGTLGERQPLRKHPWPEQQFQDASVAC